MAKGFTAREAKRVYRGCNWYIDEVKKLNTCINEFQDKTVAAAENVIREIVLDTLSEVPVEEINRGDTRVRVSALRNAGITSISKVCNTDVRSLGDINGISEDSAKLIKEIAKNRFMLAKEQTKIKLSADNRNKETTELVTAISALRLLQSLREQADYVLLTYEEQIGYAAADLLPAINSFKFIFLGKEKKTTAEKAYNYLKNLLEGDFDARAGFIVQKMAYASKLDAKEAWNDFSDNTAMFFGTLEELAPGLLGNSDTKYGLPEELAEKIAAESFLGDGLRCHLRNYQLWGVKYILHQGKVLLGDEMGLGKTVQAIASMVSLRNMGETHFAVVCPAGVLSNWIREIEKHSDLKAIKVHGATRAEALENWILGGGVCVTTYETLEHFHLDSNFFFSLFVVDEAHYIKNPKTKRTKNARDISSHAKRLLFMTGTAIENNVDEMISLVGMLQPEIAKEVAGIAFMSAAPEFRQKVSPVYYRRKREDVLTELPELIQIQDWCEMSKKEEALYDKNILGRASYPEIRRVSWNVKDLNDSSKAKRLLEIVEEAELEERKVIVFSFFLDTIGKVEALLEGRCLEPITGAVKPARRQEIIDEFDVAPPGSVLISQIQSGGTGLNIQSASVVVICEPQFKPSIENQAISRAYRMGQARNVIVHRLLCEDTVDEKLMDLLSGKQEIFNAFADTSVAADADLSWNEDVASEIDEATFGRIVKQEYERIIRKQNAK